MSVNRYDYVIIGYKMPYKFKNVVTGKEVDWWDDTFRPYIEGRPGVHYGIVLIEPNNCVVFGKILARGDDDTGFGFKNIDYDESDFGKVKEKFVELFGGYDVMDFFEKIFSENNDTGVYEPRLFAFSEFN